MPLSCTSPVHSVQCASHTRPKNGIETHPAGMNHIVQCFPTRTTSKSVKLSIVPRVAYSKLEFGQFWQKSGVGLCQSTFISRNKASHFSHTSSTRLQNLDLLNVFRKNLEDPDIHDALERGTLDTRSEHDAETKGLEPRLYQTRSLLYSCSEACSSGRAWSVE